MDISQDSTLYVLRDVPLDITYNHTILFNSVTEQETYFKSKVKHTFEKYSYLRPQKSIKVGKNSDELYDCNYLYFKNNSYGQKNWFAFIKDIEYINDTTSLITFELDVMQTWHWNYTLKPSFVEREHVVDDTIGAHRVYENLDVGELRFNKREVIEGLSSLAILVSTSYNPNNESDIEGRLYSGIYSGNGLFAFTSNPDGVASLNTFIDDMVEQGKIDAITAIFTYPKSLLPEFSNGDLISSQEAQRITYSFTPSQSVSGYTPKNNKLLTYPYNFLYVTNSNGSTGVYKFEDFRGPYGQSVDFVITGDLGPNPTVYLLPMGYKGLEYENFDESLALTQYPFCSYNYDVYKDYLAKNVVTSPLSIASSGLAVVGGIVTGNPLAIASGAIGVATTIGGFHEKAILPNQSKGVLSGSGAIAIGAQQFIMFQKCINIETARILDNYFEMYGYKVNTVKIPNRNARPHWTYLKTQNVNIVGSLPADTMEKIKEIYNSGITFWKNGNNVGNYSLNNH